ncbi:MAG: hypothetical protein IPO62_17750 [Saprospiraceae bacterium]|nr:hypothetical protein [Saprospiraceae bacterium]
MNINVALGILTIALTFLFTIFVGMFWPEYDSLKKITSSVINLEIKHKELDISINSLEYYNKKNQDTILIYDNILIKCDAKIKNLRDEISRLINEIANSKLDQITLKTKYKELLDKQAELQTYLESLSKIITDSIPENIDNKSSNLNHDLIIEYNKYNKEYSDLLANCD